MSNITLRQGFAPATLDEAMRFSDMLASSSMVPKAYQGKPQDILVCVQWGYEMGLAPMQALQNIAVINGKPSVYGDAAMALVQASPVCEGVDEYIEGEGTPNPVAVCVASRKGRKPVVAKFSVEDAKRAGLWGKQGPWQAYPKRMLQMRARGFALRDAFPDVLKGLITAEEAQDFPDEAKPRPAKDITPRNPLDAIAPPKVEPEPVIEDVVLPGTEVVDIPEVNEDVALVALAEAADIADKMVERFEPAKKPRGEIDHFNDIPGYHLRLPGKDLSHAIYKKINEWADGYESMAELVATSRSIEPRERMTKLRELKEANEATINELGQVERIQLAANYSKRLRALGASMD